MIKPSQILKQYWGYDNFRPLQEEIVKAVVEKNDVLALMPTGGGKSICFQVPALCMDGICIVITPLIALMRDQVEQLKKRGIKAAAIHSGLSHREIDILLDNCIHDTTIKFLYLSPERLKSDLLIERIRKFNVNLLAIDEAHCIAQWGYDFRPAYLEIANFRKLLPKIPVIALTATATPDVQKDILEKLELKNGKVFVKSFSRANLSYSCFEEENKIKRLLEIIAKVQGSMIVYVRSRRQTQELSSFLKKNNISASAYHAGMSTNDRNTIQDLWIHNKTRVMVATNAFGMGIDKSDVRCVIHLAPPESLEAYYQEAGRAGRDEAKAYAVLLFTKQELEELTLKIEQKYPSIELIRRTYQALANYFKIAVGSSLLAAYDFNEDDFIKTYKLPKRETFYALRRLEMEGFIQLNEGYHRPSKIFITLDHTSLYDYQLTHHELDPLIKALLRSYGGELFNNFIEISEQKLAAQAEISTAVVRKQLHYLQTSSVLLYEPAHTAPQIVLTTVRYDAAKLPLNIAEINARKNNELSKVRFLSLYTIQDRRCRSLILQEYFGEYSEVACGICDICLKNKKQTVSSSLEEEIKDRIIQLVKDDIRAVDLLVDYIPNKDREVFRMVLQTMIDSELLKIDKNGLLSLSKK